MLHTRSHVNRSELVIFRSVIEITHMKTNGDQGGRGVVLWREEGRLQASLGLVHPGHRGLRACLAAGSSVNIYTTRIYRAAATLLTEVALGPGRSTGNKTKSALEELTFWGKCGGPRTHCRQ